ncbi:MAG TPA: hypothetical protein HA264_09765 [Methanolinea sp.]|nr:hypothetical protein [Methanolinea sp.]
MADKETNYLTFLLLFLTITLVLYGAYPLVEEGAHAWVAGSILCALFITLGIMLKTKNIG